MCLTGPLSRCQRVLRLLPMLLRHFFYYAVSDLIKYLMPLLNKNLCIPAVRDLLMSILFAPYSQKIIFITGNKRHSSDTLHFKVEDAK